MFYLNVPQATQRIQSLDSECARLKSENLLARKESDAQLHELRKLQQSSGMSTEKINMAEGDARRAKAAMQVCLSPSLSLCLSLSLSLSLRDKSILVQCVLFHVEWCIR